MAKAQEEYQQMQQQAWRYLRKGMLFLAICLAVGQLADHFAVPFHILITESTTIAGWVALWKPLELLLYDLPELKKRDQNNDARRLMSR